MHEAGAASVAAQLLAFYKEPVRYRPRLTHGREAFEGGLLVFRFAQGKFPNNVMRDFGPAERARLREAAIFFIRQVCLWEGATHYQLLCVPPGARRDLVKEHYHGLMALIHPDRQDAEAGHWPRGAAQRVNDAYAVLADDASRREYDAGMAAGGAGEGPDLDELIAQAPRTAAVHAPIRGRAAAARLRYRRPVLVVAAVIAGLFFFQVWIAGEVPREYAALQSATPFDASARWMRDVFASSERPRYLAPAETPRGRASEPEAEVRFFTPLWRALTTPVGQARDVTVARDALAAAPAVLVDAAPAPQPAPAVSSQPALKLAVAPRERAIELAQAPVVQAAPAPKPEAASTADMEMLVALLITHYEAGDLDRFLALQDAQSISVWEAWRLRNDFQEFFGNTKGRRLRLNRVSLDTEGTVARARGDATLVAEYIDEPRRIERVVRLELDAVLRDGQLKIARLVLFPHGG